KMENTDDRTLSPTEEAMPSNITANILTHPLLRLSDCYSSAKKTPHRGVNPGGRGISQKGAEPKKKMGPGWNI
ncbi:hypothetical protein NL531_32440, partial [Klebsiella pneumoniae]|nr:hypothetical protein [Klebsiella pneumoniae]